MSSKKRVLIHACCGPCLVSPYLEMKESKFEIEVYFYNPNIHPLKEYRLRLAALKEYFKEEDITLKIEQYNIIDYFSKVDLGKDCGERCKKCYELRLKELLKKAESENFDYFTTTLLASPYQNHEFIKEIAVKMSKDRQVDFYYNDFRKDYYKGVNLFKDRNLYYQKYCGCLLSEVEKYEEKQRIKK
ncbi:MAG: epoxyqueuosine reductase QueH [Actinomycetia bacterium]|nr:epoxyqueuosine reductase QueH [Actinomycetes bacterium]